MVRIKKNTGDNIFKNNASWSFGGNVFKNFDKHIERCTSKFFYSVNRAEKRLEKYNSQGFYNFKFKKRWKSVLYKFTHTYHIEFLGKKLNYKNNLNKNN